MDESTVSLLILAGVVLLVVMSFRNKKKRARARGAYRDEYYAQHGQYPSEAQEADAGFGGSGGDDGGGDDGGGDD